MPHHELVAALMRELQEELGIRPTNWKYLETLTVALDEIRNEVAAAKDSLTAHLYLVTAWDGTPINRQPEEHCAIAWFSLDQAKQLPLADPIYPVLFAKVLDSQ